jgi:hypothetical protein
MKPEDKNPKVREAMDTLLKIFKDDNLEKVARAVFRGDAIPSDKWSFANRMIMLLSDTEDARGYKQWQEVGRTVKKGTHAFHILAPLMKKQWVDVKNKVTGIITREERMVLIGFKSVPVFRFEDTEGEPLIKNTFEISIPYEFNNIIQELGLTISPTRYCETSYGSYNPYRKEIKLASPDIEIFLHEISHAVDDKLHGIRSGQHDDQEVTAEFSAAVIAYLMGYKLSLGNIRSYIESYSFTELMKCLNRIEKIVLFVIDRTTGIQVPVVV